MPIRQFPVIAWAAVALWYATAKKNVAVRISTAVFIRAVRPSLSWRTSLATCIGSGTVISVEAPGGRDDPWPSDSKSGLSAFNFWPVGDNRDSAVGTQQAVAWGYLTRTRTGIAGTAQIASRRSIKTIACGRCSKGDRPEEYGRSAWEVLST